MSREILFRTWTGQRFWYFDISSGFNNENCDTFSSPEQYTGTLGLYEGDIISDHNGIGTIQYSEKFAAFKVIYTDKENQGRAKWFYDYLHSEWSSIEKIGNIHENKELLRA